MFTCAVCGNNESKTEYIDDVFHIDGRYVLVEHIPAIVCRRCGEPSFSRETTEMVRKLVRSEKPPAKTEQMDVFALA